MAFASEPKDYAGCSRCKRQYQQMDEPVKLPCGHFHCLPCLCLRQPEEDGAEVAGTEEADMEEADAEQADTQEVDMLTCSRCGEHCNALMIITRHLYNPTSISQKGTNIVRLFDGDLILRAVQSKSPFDDCDDGSALNFALKTEHYALAESLLRFLKGMPPANQSQTLAIRNSAGNNALQLFIYNVSRLENVCANDELKVPETETKLKLERMKQVWKLLMDFQHIDEDLIKRTNDLEQSAVSFATLCSLSTFNGISILEDLMAKLSSSSQIDVIKQLQSCNCDEIDDKAVEECEHKKYCTEGYNLLMLALSSKIFDNIDSILSIIKQAPQVDQLEILSNGREPECYVDRPTCLRVAALHKLPQYCNQILSIMPEEQQSAACLEFDNRIGTALGQIIQSNSLNDFFKIFKEDKIFQAQFQKILEENCWRSNFEEIEASLKAIQSLSELGIPKQFYFLPRWSRDKAMSRPEAVIFYNTFKHSQWLDISDVEPAVINLEAALLDLGWDIDAVKLMDDGWTFEELKEKIEKHCHTLRSENRASLFLLCITSHGEDEKILASSGSDGVLLEKDPKLCKEKHMEHITQQNGDTLSCENPQSSKEALANKKPVLTDDIAEVITRLLESADKLAAEIKQRQTSKELLPEKYTHPNKAMPMQKVAQKSEDAIRCKDVQQTNITSTDKVALQSRDTNNCVNPEPGKEGIIPEKANLTEIAELFTHFSECLLQAAAENKQRQSSTDLMQHALQHGDTYLHKELQPSKDSSTAKKVTLTDEHAGFITHLWECLVQKPLEIKQRQSSKDLIPEKDTQPSKAMPMGEKSGETLAATQEALKEAEKAALTRGDIDDIIRLMIQKVPKHIPKVFLLDVCRRRKSPDPEKSLSLDKNDTWYLLSTRCNYGAKAGLYIQKLADQIALANGRTSLLEMHREATVEVQIEAPSQEPRCLPANKDICLSRLSKKDNFPTILIYSNAFKFREYRRSSVAVGLRNTLLHLGWPLKVIQLEGKGSGMNDLYSKLVDLVNQQNQEDHALLLCCPSYEDKSHSKSKNVNESDSEEDCGRSDDTNKIFQVLNEIASVERSELLIVEIVNTKRKSRRAELTKEYAETEKVLFLKGDDRGNTVHAEMYLEKLTKLIEQADGETKLLEMHDNAALETTLDGRKHVPQQVSSRWRERKNYKFRCASCQNYIEPTAKYINCSKCSNVCHLGCTDVSEENLEMLKKVKGFYWNCCFC